MRNKVNSFVRTSICSKALRHTAADHLPKDRCIQGGREGGREGEVESKKEYIRTVTTCV